MRGEHDDRIPGWLRATLGTLGDVVVFAALSLVIWTVLPAVAMQATPVIIGGGSMSPLIRAGDVILLDDTPPPDGERFAPGAVITFEALEGGGLVTHRVANVVDGHYVTRGDANTSDDPRAIHPDQVVGVGRWLIPAIGLPAHWARTGAWHLVALTVLGGAAAVAASLAGRPRVAVEVTDEAADDLPLDVPEVAPTRPGIAEPAFAEPVLAFDLEPEPAADLAATPGIAPDTERPEHATEHDDERLDPAAAERAAAVAAQAARRSIAGLDRVRDEQDEHEEALRGAGRRDQHDSAGSAPVAAVLAIATALIASTLAPSFAVATYVAATTNPTNSFSIAEAPSTSTFALLRGGGGNFITEGNPNNVTRFVPTAVVPAQTLAVKGNLVVNLAILETRGAHKSVEVIVDIDGQAVSATATGLTSGARQLVLDPQLDTVIPGGTSITIEIISRGVDLEGDGASTITFPG